MVLLGAGDTETVLHPRSSVGCRRLAERSIEGLDSRGGGGGQLALSGKIEEGFT